MTLRGAVALALSLALAVAAPVARASDTHYQDFPIGQRAMGMGGAYVALSDDPSASWYNPGGLGLMSRTSASASLGLYGIERRAVDQGFGNADLRQLTFPILTTTFSVMTKFGSSDGGGGPRNAVGISLFLPFNQGISFRGLAPAGGPAGADYFVTETDRTLWVGPTFARRIGRNFALGFSLFYENRSYSRSSEVTSTLTPGQTGQPCPGTPTACSVATAIDASMGSLFLRVGALLQVDQNWRFGAAFSTPNVSVHGGANLFTRRLSASVGAVDYQVDSRADQASYSRRPFELRVGTAYVKRESFTISTDLSLHGPATYRRIDTEGLIGDPLFVREVRREAVVNLNVGAELLVRPHIPVRFGVYTNFSSAPELPERTAEAYLTRVHMFGASASIGYLGDGYGLDFGVSASFGTGVTQAIDPTDPTMLRRANVNHSLFYFFISGIGQALARNVQRLLDRFKGL